MKNNAVLTWSWIVALGGFLFGFDTAVISGAEIQIQQFWHLSDFAHGITVSIALFGTVIGALSGSTPSDKFGRKNTLYFVALAFFLASLGTAFTDNWYIFLFFRFLGGLGVGISSITAPVYISEIAPAARRGRLVGLFQFNVVLGIVIAYLSNYLIQLFSTGSWRVMLGIQALPALAFLLLLRLIPESPRWLVLKKNNEAKAAEVLKIIDPNNYQQELAAIKNSVISTENLQPNEKLFSAAYRKPVILAMLVAFFNQVSGINAILYFAPRILKAAGLGAQSALLSTVGIGIINFAFTLLAITIIDKVGRRTLMRIGSVGLVAALLLIAFTFQSQQTGGIAIPIYMMVFIAFFAFSQGAVIWVFISEIFPNQVRAKGQTLGSSTHWVMDTIITFSFPFVASHLGEAVIFYFFGAMMALQFVFSWRFMPETKGKSLEQIESNIITH